MKEVLYIQFVNSVAIFALLLASVRADGVTPIKDMPVTLLKTGARTFAGLQAGSPLVAVQEKPRHSQHEITEDDDRILTAILRKAEEKQQVAEAAAAGDTGEYEDDEKDYYEDDEDDDRCPEEGEIFFEKSGQCVPRICPTGTRRDLETGFCHKKLTGLRRHGMAGWSYSPYYHR